MKRSFFEGGGEMGALMRAFDWSKTPLGDTATWPQSLRTAVRILLTTHHPMFIWWGPELIQFYNDAYSKTMGPERHPSALGQRGQECWAEIWDLIGPQINYVMEAKGATWNEDRLVPTTRHGRRQDIWWTYSFSPIDDDTAESGVGGVLVVCNDVTKQHLLLEEMRAHEARLEAALAAGVVGTYDWNVDEDRIIADARFADFYGVDPAEAKGGVPLSHFFMSIHRDDAPRVAAAVQATVAGSGDFNEEYRVVHADGSFRWVSATGRCFSDRETGMRRFAGTVIDITERKVAEEHRKLLTQELDHRVKNMLATVQAIANQTLRDGMSMRDAREAFAARIMALANAQDILLGRTRAGADLRAVFTTALRPHGGGHSRVRFEGEALHISPRAGFSLALAAHELATNAAKYGALSTSEGLVTVSWQVDPATGMLRFSWVESGGPAVNPPKRRGFGSRLIEGTLAAEIGAEVKVDYGPEGVKWFFKAPLDNLTRIDLSPELA